MTDRTGEEGFTLVELLVVLGILAAVTLIALPYASTSGTNRKLDAMANDIATALRTAQFKSLNLNRPTDVIFDVRARRITMSIDTHAINVPPDVDLRITSARGGIVSDNARLRFFPEGGSTGGRIDLTWNAEAGAITVNWLTGAVVITKGTAP
jgi:general secretion pathway protein H